MDALEDNNTIPPRKISIMRGEDPYREAFTTIRVRKGRYLALNEHMSRLNDHLLELGIIVDRNKLNEIQFPECEDSLVRVSVNRNGEVSVQTREAPILHRKLKALCFDFPSTLELFGFTGHKFSEQGSNNAVVHTPDVNNQTEDLGRIVGLKHGAWAFYRIVGQICRQQDYDVGLLVDNKDVVIDGDRATPLLVSKTGELIACKENCGCVESITLQILGKKLSEIGIQISRRRVTRQCLLDASEVLMVGSGVGVAKITNIDGVDLGQKDTIQKKLCALFDDLLDQPAQSLLVPNRHLHTRRFEDQEVINN